MSRINVLEVRYAATREGPWGEPSAVNRVVQDPEDWGEPHKHPIYKDRWEQMRVVPYERVDASLDAMAREAMDAINAVGFIYDMRGEAAVAEALRQRYLAACASRRRAVVDPGDGREG